MAHYAIGDIQGCYSELMALLDKMAFNDNTDTLWLTGDLINGGKENLAVLRFLSQLPNKPVVVLGNHDLHFLAVFYNIRSLQPDDTFQDILNAPNVDELCHWLQSQSLAHYHEAFNTLMIHAGILSHWSLQKTLMYAKEIETALNPNTPEQAQHFLKAIFGLQQGEKETHWRFITDVLTRLRFCDSQGKAHYHYKGTLKAAPSALSPWFQFLQTTPLLNTTTAQPIDILFGHWAALETPSKILYPHLFPLDTGCAWGGYLTALRLEDKQWFQVKGKKYR